MQVTDPERRTNAMSAFVLLLRLLVALPFLGASVYLVTVDGLNGALHSLLYLAIGSYLVVALPE